MWANHHTNSFIILFILARGSVKSSSSAEGGGHSSSCGLFIVLLCVSRSLCLFYSSVFIDSQIFEFGFLFRGANVQCIHCFVVVGTLNAHNEKISTFNANHKLYEFSICFVVEN